MSSTEKLNGVHIATDLAASLARMQERVDRVMAGNASLANAMTELRQRCEVAEKYLGRGKVDVARAVLRGVPVETLEPLPAIVDEHAHDPRYCDACRADACDECGEEAHPHSPCNPYKEAAFRARCGVPAVKELPCTRCATLTQDDGKTLVAAIEKRSLHGMSNALESLRLKGLEYGVDPRALAQASSMQDDMQPEPRPQPTAYERAANKLALVEDMHAAWLLADAQEWEAHARIIAKYSNVIDCTQCDPQRGED